MSWPLCESRGLLIERPAGPLVHGGKLLDSLYRTGDMRAAYCQTLIITLDPGGLLPDEVEAFLATLPPPPAEPPRAKQRGLFD